ncbi:galactose oxidase [Piedraia hortae CBS 480.64]|uniref:Galactose oxidase n=1 Tax=Piedraia hortae CBS 480.64 TaxID=1314780 RepID=A0A6A7C3R7_9PEZI|nr:galactose oxidase [Piedraia hortae CBS 480.64]
MASVPNGPSQTTKRRNEELKIITTVGQRPACLVNASVTYVGNGVIYAFGGFDQFTDEVYNHVLKLDLKMRKWTLVDNYGEIPGVRMGHSACLWQDSKLLVFGGENEHRTFLSDLVVFDIETAHWKVPKVRGPTPRRRARHAAVVHDEKLFICGGISSNEGHVLDDICFLDLRTMTWSPSWRFVARYDHSCGVWGNQAPERASSLGRVANTSLVQASAATVRNNSLPIAPGTINKVRFVSSPELPMQKLGTHFHVFSSGCMLDFVSPMPATTQTPATSLSILDLETLRWQKLADGSELFSSEYRWHYCCPNEDGSRVWLLGCPRQVQHAGTRMAEEFLSDVLPIDLRRYGVLGNMMSQKVNNPLLGISGSTPMTALGSDLAKVFNQPPESGSGADFMVTAIDNEDNTSAPIHVHRFVLCARWPHFSRLLNSHMQEFNTGQMHIPEPLPAVKAFLYYLYADSISSPMGKVENHRTPKLEDVANMLVMSNIYDMPRLRLLCVNRIVREMDIRHAALVFERASVAQEEWLRNRAADFCLNHWGRVVRTMAFKSLSREALLELCQHVEQGGRVVNSDEVEVVEESRKRIRPPEDDEVSAEGSEESMDIS